MPEIIWKYYLAKGPEADDVLSRAKQAWDGIKAHRESLMEEYKANGVLPGDRKKYTYILCNFVKSSPIFSSWHNF